MSARDNSNFKKAKSLVSFVFLSVLMSSTLTFAEDTICDSNTNQTALVVIDMQPEFFTRGGNDKEPANVKKVEDIIAAQVEAIKKARSQNIPIIFIEYDCTAFKIECGDTNSSLKEAVRNYRTVKYFKKTSDGMLESRNKNRSDLVGYLKQNNVGNLVITGANGGACVLRSITGALDGNCSVLAYSNGIADFNYKNFIYPYVGQYKNIKLNCKDCKFRETASIDDVIEAMASGSNLQRNAPAANESRGVR